MQSVEAPLARAKVYLAAGDYRRAVEACQMNIDQSPSVESYVYLIYVYHALDGYLEWLSKRDEWVKVGAVVTLHGQPRNHGSCRSFRSVGQDGQRTAA